MSQDGDRGRSYEAAVERAAHCEDRPVMRLPNGQGIVSFLGDRFAEGEAQEARVREAEARQEEAQRGTSPEAGD